MLNHYYPFAEAAFKKPFGDRPDPTISKIAWPVFEQTGMFLDLDGRPFSAIRKLKRRRFHHDD